MRDVLVACCLAAASLALSAPAAAAAPADPTASQDVRRISYADLDLRSEAGLATLHRRVDHAIYDVCANGVVVDVSQDMRRAKLCRAKVRDETAQQIAAAVERAQQRFARNGEPSVIRLAAH